MNIKVHYAHPAWECVDLLGKVPENLLPPLTLCGYRYEQDQIYVVWHPKSKLGHRQISNVTCEACILLAMEVYKKQYDCESKHIFRYKKQYDCESKHIFRSKK